MSYKPEAIQRVINTLLRWRDYPDFCWDYNFQCYIDEDGIQYGDTLAVYLYKIAGVKDLGKYVRERGGKQMILEFASYTGMPLDHVVALGTLGGIHAWEDAPSFDMISPRDVAWTLNNYLFAKGKCYPDWSWYARATMDDSAPTLDEFVAKCKSS